MGACQFSRKKDYVGQAPLYRYVTISQAHSVAVSVTTSFAGWSCCARRSPTLECILKALCLRVGKNTHTDDVVQSFINSLVQIFCFVVTGSLILVGRQIWHHASPYKPLVIYMKDPKK